MNKIKLLFVIMLLFFSYSVSAAEIDLLGLTPTTPHAFTEQGVANLSSKINNRNQDRI